MISYVAILNVEPSFVLQFEAMGVIISCLICTYTKYGRYYYLPLRKGDAGFS